MTGSADGCINFYHVGGSEQPLCKIDGAHDSSIWDVAWHPVGHSVASISNDQLLRFWTRNRPGDKFDDKHNLTARQDGNVDLSKVFRATSDPSHGAAPEGVQMPAIASVFLSDAASAVIPGMSSTQAKNRRMRPQSIAPSRPGATPTVELRVLNYDMLAQANSVTRNFPDVSESLLSWPYRSQNLLLEIRQRNSDVLCLQEVSFYREFWQQNLKGYQAAFQAHPDATSGKCVAIMTRPSKLALRQAVQVRFTDEDQAFRSVAVIGIYETAVSVALKEKDARAPRTMFVIASVSLSNYGNEVKRAAFCSFSL
jgi:hypothetical protein